MTRAEMWAEFYKAAIMSGRRFGRNEDGEMTRISTEEGADDMLEQFEKRFPRYEYTMPNSREIYAGSTHHPESEPLPDVPFQNW